MFTEVSTIIVNEQNLPQLIPLLQAYSGYMYETLDLVSGKEKFEKELKSFPLEKYSYPVGCFLLAVYNNEVVGCIGLSKYNEVSCEMKRMYTLPASRQKGVARKMVNDCIEVAKKLGYKYILLDTNKEMKDAVLLYRKMGFEEIAAWCENENPNPMWFRYTL